MEKSSQGGQRAGAGRKPLEKVAFSKLLQVRVSEKMALESQRLGGAVWIRETLKKAISENRDNLKSRIEPTIGNLYRIEPSASLRLARLDMRAPCGFPSPAADYAVDDLDINDYLVNTPSASYIIEAAGDSMVDAGIFSGDLLIVDRALEPKSGDIVLAVFDGAFTVKRLRLKNGEAELHPENASGNYPVLKPKDWQSLQIEGVIISAMKRFR